MHPVEETAEKTTNEIVDIEEDRSEVAALFHNYQELSPASREELKTSWAMVKKEIDRRKTYSVSQRENSNATSNLLTTKDGMEPSRAHE